MVGNRATADGLNEPRRDPGAERETSRRCVQGSRRRAVDEEDTRQPRASRGKARIVQA